MNDSADDDDRSVERSCDAVQITDLGNAKVETKQYNPVQWWADSLGQLGWGF